MNPSNSDSLQAGQKNPHDMKIVLNLIDICGILSQGQDSDSAGLVTMAIHRFLDRLKSMPSIQHRVVWTSCPVLEKATRSHGYQVLPYGFPTQVTSLNRATPREWDQMTSHCLDAVVHTSGDLKIFIDTRCFMMKTATIEKMCDTLLEDEQAHVVFPVYPVDPHIYLSVPENAGYFPMWEHPGLDRQKYPTLYRKVEAFVYHPYRPTFKQPLKELPYPVPWYEGKVYWRNAALLAFAVHKITQIEGMDIPHAIP